jgi:RNA polymerase sigma factor FliA
MAKSTKAKVVQPPIIALEEYLPTVQYWARHYSHQSHQVLDFDDLVVVGLMGLMDAAKRFNPNRDVQFKTYAEFRIRGEIIDELRKQDWMSRSERKKQKVFRHAQQQLVHDLGRDPTRQEMAKILPFKSRELDRIQQYETNDSIRAYQEGDSAKLEDFVSQEIENRDEVQELISMLPKTHKRVIELRYFEDASLSSIAKDIGLSEGRVSQIHTEAIEILRNELKTLSAA